MDVELPELKIKDHGTLVDINGIRKSFAIERYVTLPVEQIDKQLRKHVAPISSSPANEPGNPFS